MPTASILPNWKTTADSAATLATAAGKRARWKLATSSMQAAFIRSKVHIAWTHPGSSLKTKEQRLAPMLRKLGKLAPDLAEMPVPGGVGYGYFYNPGFRSDFVTGTAITVGYVCPATAGGNVNQQLFVTSTNRANLGVEALVAWEGSQQAIFSIYDWSVGRRSANDGRGDPNIDTQRYVYKLDYGQLANYLLSQEVAGQVYPMLLVQNTTFQLSSGVWRNLVQLFNSTTGKWDGVYQKDYSATTAVQTRGWPGSWGPIVETFQPHYTGTNLLGVFGAQVMTAGADNRWSAPTTLSPNEVDPQADQVGFHQAFLDPNQSWLVES